MSTKTIAMTGATGFAGRHTLEALLARGFRVKALARNGRTAALPSQIELVEGDLQQAEALASLAHGADAVLHLAGVTTALDRTGYFAVNVHGTAALAAAARKAGAARFVHVSSLSAREPSLTPYAASKAEGEKLVAAAFPQALIIRPPAIYGPGDRATLPLVREFIRPFAMIPSTPNARFSLIHAADLAVILAEAITSEQQGIVEVSDGKEGGYGWAELCAIGAAHEGHSVRPIFLPRIMANAAAYVSESIARVRSKPGMINSGKIAELYHPDWVVKGTGWPMTRSIPFAEGFAGTVAWYRAQGWLPPGRRTVTSGASANHESHS